MKSGRPRSIPSCGWWIGGILFASTVINYIDRKTLSILAPYLKQDITGTKRDLRQYRDRLSHRLFVGQNRVRPA